MDVQTHIVYKPECLAEESFETLHKTLNDAASFQSKHVKTNFVKFMLDGVPLAPYYTHAGLTESGEIDESKIQIDDLKEAVARFDARGMTCKIHCTGYGSTRRALDVFEAVRKSNKAGPKHEIAHCCVSSSSSRKTFPWLKELLSLFCPYYSFRQRRYKLIVVRRGCTTMTILASSSST